MTYNQQVLNSISKASGQGSLKKPAIKIFPIFAQPSLGTSIALNLREAAQSGSCMLWSRNLSDQACQLYVAFDELTFTGTANSAAQQIPSNIIQLTAGNVLDLRPLQWNTFTIVVVPTVNGPGVPVSFGTLAVGDSFYQDSNGGALANGGYSLPGLHKTSVIQDWNANRSGTSGWSGPQAGATGIFTYIWTNLQNLSNTSGSYRSIYKNIGSNILYVSSNPNLKDSTLASAIQQTFPIQPGESFTFDETGANSVGGTLNFLYYIYSADANAAVAAINTYYGV